MSTHGRLVSFTVSIDDPGLVAWYQVRAVGRTEKAVALAWWDRHLDRVYASLNLPRDLHLIRGTE